ncbi:MAG: thioesterase family protein [Candidatus Heimdallarchaeaceae archaeon]
MDFKIEPNIKLEKEYKVADNHTAKFLGSGEVEVLATPFMIAYMEQTCLEAVQPSLPEGYTTVGIKVCISHLAASPKGATILVKSQLLEQKDRKLTFHVEAWWKETKIGEGEHERFIINKERFLERLKASMSQA